VRAAHEADRHVHRLQEHELLRVGVVLRGRYLEATDVEVAHRAERVGVGGLRRHHAVPRIRLLVQLEGPVRERALEEVRPLGVLVDRVRLHWEHVHAVDQDLVDVVHRHPQPRAIRHGEHVADDRDAGRTRGPG
jgi:hypothetical protein